MTVNKVGSDEESGNDGSTHPVRDSLRASICLRNQRAYITRHRPVFCLRFAPQDTLGVQRPRVARLLEKKRWW